ncbi:MAG: hypothetical protein H7259_06675 [Cytophagales bacterium]|nr:hypothetical protein [Cytophaga sp.]
MILFPSCNKKNTDKNTPSAPATSSSCLLSAIVDSISGDTINAYQYDVQKRLKVSATYTNGIRQEFFTYVYSADTITQYLQNDAGTQYATPNIYVLQENNTAAFLTHSLFAPIDTPSVYVYNGAGQLIYQILRHHVSGTMLLDTILKYKYQNGNLIKSEYTQDAKVYYREYTYGTDADEAYTFSTRNRIMPGLFGKDNAQLPTSYQYTNTSQSSANYTMHYFYTFDSNGYPVKVKGIPSIGSPEIGFTVYYKYQCP